MEDKSDNISYVHPRNPSMYFGRRFFEGGKTNLLSQFGGGQLVRGSKEEKMKVYLRIKPTKDAAQMLPPPQASETHVVCVWVCSGLRSSGMCCCDMG
jgi:hypothetical protein